MQEVIEHCEKTVKKIEKEHERYRNWLELEPVPITVKQYWEHKQTAEWLKELQHYKDLEEQGLLLELPCKVGDRVWYIDGKSTVRYLIFDYEWLGYYKAEELFATKEEAEAKLKELKGE